MRRRPGHSTGERSTRPRARRPARPARRPGRRAAARCPTAAPTSIVSSSLSSHQSPRRRRTGSMPSKRAEGDERARADDARHLALELGVPAALEQLGLEQEAARDGVAAPLDRHRVALAHRAPLARGLHVRGPRRVLAGADRGQQRAVADQVRVAADRRGEVAVARRAQPGVADVLRGVVRLLERAQDERGQRGAPVAAAADLLVDEAGDLGDEVGALLRRHRLRQRRRRDVERRELVDEPLDAARARAARARGRAPAAGASRAASRPPRWPRSSGARSAGATPSARSTRAR